MNHIFKNDRERVSKLINVGYRENLNEIKVTIIVATYNNEKFLDRCLMSLIKQTMKDIEIIVVNDGSTDNTESILSTYEKSDYRIKVINQENAKQGTARNKGLDIATGEFVTFVDSDDWVDVDYCEKLYNAAIRNNVNIAAACITRDYNNKVKNHLKYNKEEVFRGGNEIVEGLKKHLETHSKLYRFEYIKDLRFPEEVFYEDAPYTLSVILREQSMVTVPEAHYHYYSNSNSTIKQNGGIKNENDKIEMNLLLLDIARKNNIELNWEVIKERHLLWSIKHYIDHKDFYLFGVKIKTINTPFDNEKVFVVFNTSCFGDVLLCNSCCQNIKRAFPNSKIVFVVNKGFEEVARYQEGVDDVVTYDKKGKHKGILGIFKFVKEFKYKNVFASIVTYNNVRNYLIAKLIKSRFINMGTRDNAVIHSQVKHNNLLKSLTNRNIKNFPIKYNVPTSLNSLIDEQTKYIVMCTTSKKLEKDLPIDIAIKLIDRINAETNYKVVFVGAGDIAMNYAISLKDAGCKFINLVNETTIPELGAVIKNAQATISVNTGTMHLSYAVGCPTVCLFYLNYLVPFWAPMKDVYPHTKVLSGNEISCEKIFAALKLEEQICV